MKKHLLIGLILSALLTACGIGGKTPPSRFYQMQAISFIDTTTIARNTLVGVHAVRVPQSIDRPQLVIHNADSNMITINEFERWIEPLSDMITNTIAADMTRHTKNLTVRPLPIKTNRTIKYYVSVDIVKFDTFDNGDVTLDAWWTISDDAGNIRLERNTTITEHADMKSNGFDAVVSAHSLVVAKMANKIADEIIKLEK